MAKLGDSILVTAHVEGDVSNRRLQEICEEHPANLSRLLRGLVAGGFLLQDGQKRWTSYRLPENTAHKHTGSSHSTQDSSHSRDSSHKVSGDSSHRLEDLTPEELATL
jgi:hypothetical protein